jgi:NAD(P)-dependent dehydrogenase (short-subunit alcohol dehydrogenase family)
MDLESMVAWVAAADEPRGRAVALALAARGMHVLVTGKNERAIAECVGEIAHGGGKARHFVGDALTEGEKCACAAAAVERFGAVHLAVVADCPGDDAWRRHLPNLRVVTPPCEGDEGAAVSAVLEELARSDR